MNAIAQDQTGFLWFGTGDGLYRYDGYTTLSFKNDPKNPRSLDLNFVKTILCDRNKRIWVGTPTGLNCIDITTNAVTRLSIAGYVQALVQMSDGNIWVGTQGNGLFIYNESGSLVHHLNRTQRGLPSDSIGAILEQKDGSIWIGSTQGIVRRRGNDTTFVSFNPPHMRGIRPSVSCFFQDSRGEIWVCTKGNGVLRINDHGEFLNHFDKVETNPSSLSGNWITSVTEDLDGTLWFGTLYFGINRFNREVNSFTRSVNENLSSDRAFSGRTIFTDRSGIVWIGTGQGVRKFDPMKALFFHYRPSSRNSGLTDHINAIQEDLHGNLWFGLDGIKERAGLVRYDRKRDVFIPVRGSDTNPATIYPRVRSMVIDKNGIFWLGTFGGGLYRFNPRTGAHRSFRHHPDDSSSINSDLIQCLTKDEDGILWIGTIKGLNSFDPSTLKFQGYLPNWQVLSGPSQPNVKSLMVSRGGSLWVGTVGAGLYEFDRNGRSFLRKIQDLNNASSITKDVINVIHEDRHGALWIGTDQGLKKYDPPSGIVSSFSAEENLTNAFVRGIQEDSTGSLWIMTDAELSRFTERRQFNGHFQTFAASKGLLSGVVEAAYTSSTGEFIFGGDNGAIGFFPSVLKEPSVVPSLTFTGFYISSKPALMDKLPHEIGIIEVPYSANVLSFEFSALDFVSPSENRYAYKLEGFDDDWTDAGTRRYFTYTNLDPGTYTLRVRASNSRGIWNEEGLSLLVTVIPPWWRTTWAYISYIIAIGSILFSARRYEMDRQRHKHKAELEHAQAEKLKEVDQLKSRFFANISHEFRTPLTLIEGPAQQLASGESEDPQEIGQMIARNSRRLLRLVNQLLDFSKLESGQMSLRVREMDVVDAVRTIAASFESLAARKRIEFVIDAIESPILGWVDRDAVEKILVNLLSNAFKFTEKEGKVVVRVLCHSERSEESDKSDSSVVARRAPLPQNGTRYSFVTIAVSDTGVGIPAHLQQKIFNRFYQVDDTHTREQEGTGIGLALTKELVELHHGSIAVESAQGRGSTFTVRLPIEKESYKAEEIIEGEVPALVRPPAGTIHELSLPKESVEIGESVTDESQPLVLIIEDNADMRRYIRSHIEDHYRVAEAANGEEGLNRAFETIPDL
ncbi:MAG: hypothetical protein A2X67_11785, partial [Ignavibacteria bacterium GWA2_55_11]